MTYSNKVDEDEHDFILLPNPKRPRLESAGKTEEIPSELAFSQYYLLATSDKHIPPELPTQLLSQGKIRNDTSKLRRLLDGIGFRSSVVSSPREAVSIYIDSCKVSENAANASDGKTWLVIMLGLHPRQERLEHFYQRSVKEVYCLMLFCQRVRKICLRACQDTAIADLIAGCELQCRSLGHMKSHDFTSSQIIQHAHALSASVPRLVATLIRRLVQAGPRNRVEQLQREFDRISIWNSTLSNAMVSLFMENHQCDIKEILFKQSPQTEYERITIYLHDPQIDPNKPSHFLFLPRVRTILREGPEVLVEVMIASFWSHMLRRGYFSTQAMKDRLSGELKSFFLSGITSGPHVPLQLNAHFTPTRPLSLYLHGEAGAGKSSFVRKFQPALEATIEQAADPEILARFVKQNLNKRLEVLELELELRPNNNDLSVMSIIQGRRMTLTQSKAGLVVIDLEEMPCNDPISNPNQLKVAQLISQRFSGRNGAFQDTDRPAPRNSDKRGIADDASLVTLFTSNYELDTASREALGRLKMFETLDTVEITAVSGENRMHFASSYLRQCIMDRFVELDPRFEITLDINVGKGDTRPLVRYLRMIAFYICSAVAGSVRYSGTIEARVQQKGSNYVIIAGGETLELRTGALGNLFPAKLRIHDSRIGGISQTLTEISNTETAAGDLATILDFWLAKTLAPAVIVSNDRRKVKKLMDSLGSVKDILCIKGVDADTYKMMRSLYDPNDTPNLRDDILKLGRRSTVAVEIACPCQDSQLCIREIIEDSPSMTAYSTSKSALYKEGLLFAVYVSGEISPEIRSRASIIL